MAMPHAGDPPVREPIVTFGLRSTVGVLDPVFQVRHDGYTRTGTSGALVPAGQHVFGA